MTIQLSTEELFDLGAAYGSFSIGEIDQGIHLVLPVTDSETNEPSNQVFKDLADSFLLIDPMTDYSVIGIEYMNAIVRWCHQNSIEIGREELIEDED